MSAETVQQGWVPTTDFGTRLLLARKHIGLTVREAASRSGVHYATWSTWERGARPADMAAEVNKISQALGVDRAWLMWGATELPRMDSNHQPAGHRNPLVTGRFGAEILPFRKPIVPTPDAPRCTPARTGWAAFAQVTAGDEAA